MEERFYDRYWKDFMRCAPSSMQEGCLTPWASAYIWSPQDVVPVYHEAMDLNKLASFKEDIRSIMGPHKAHGVIFRTIMKVTADWTLPGSDVVDRSEKDAVVIGLIHTSLQFPAYTASAKMADQVLEEKANPEGRWGKPPIMSEWVTVPRESIPDDFTDLPIFPM